MAGHMLDRPTAAIPLDRETLVARFDGIRQFARGGRRAPHKPLLLLYALARLKHDRQTEIRFNATEAVLQPLLRSYGPWGSAAHVSYPYSRLVNDGLWRLPDRADLVDTKGNVREGIAPARRAGRLCARCARNVRARTGADRRRGAPPARTAISRQGCTRRSWRRSASSSAPQSPSAGAMLPSGRRYSRPTLPSVASAASRCAWWMA